MSGKRTDNNHAAIRDGLRQCGYQVLDMHEVGKGFPDLLVVTKQNRRIVLLEVKTLSGKFTEPEQEFNRVFLGPHRVVRSLETAIGTLEYYDRFDDPDTED